MLFAILSSIIAFSSISQAQEFSLLQTPQVHCEFYILKVNMSVVRYPAAKNEFINLNLKPTKSQPTQPQFNGSFTAEVPLVNDSLKMQGFVTVTQNASIWSQEPRDRLQLQLVMMNSKNQIISTVREHTDRVVRDYQIDNIVKSNKQHLQLSVPVPMGWEALFANPELMDVIQKNGIDSAIEKAYAQKVLSGEEAQEISIQCQKVQ